MDDRQGYGKYLLYRQHWHMKNCGINTSCNMVVLAIEIFKLKIEVQVYFGLDGKVIQSNEMFWPSWGGGSCVGMGQGYL